MAVAPRIVFFALRDVHVPVLLPVCLELARRGGCEVGFTAPPYQPGKDAFTPVGLPEDVRAHLQALSIPLWEHRPGDRFDCVVVADACYDRVDGWGPVVCIGHGTIGKGLYFRNHPVTRRENFARVLCVPGPWYAQSFGDQVFTHIVPTGFSKMDDLAVPSADHRRDVLTGLGLDPAKRTMLFAPTFNRTLTSLGILFKTWATLDPGEYQVLFKLHGATDELWKRRYRELAARSPHLRYIDDASLSPYLLAADVVISDVSSAYLEAMTTGTPVIVVNNPAMTTYRLFNADDVEYLARDAAYQIGSGDELLATLTALKAHDPLAPVRVAWTQRLFAPLDGRCSSRIANQILKVVHGQLPCKLPRPGDRMAVFLADGVTHADRLEVIAANIRKAGSSLTLFQRGSGPASVAGLPVQRLRPGQSPPQPFICMTGAFVYPDDWDLLWFAASHFTPGAEGLFGPMLPDRDECGPQRHTRFFPRLPTLPDSAVDSSSRQARLPLQTLYKHAAFGQLAAVAALADDGVIVSRGVPGDLAARWLDHRDRREALSEVATQLAARQLFVGVVPAFFAVDSPP